MVMEPRRKTAERNPEEEIVQVRRRTIQLVDELHHSLGELETILQKRRLLEADAAAAARNQNGSAPLPQLQREMNGHDHTQ